MARLKSVNPDEDIAIGARIRILRKEKKISQTELGKTLGVTFQQIQKYENGKNRVSGSNLLKMSEALNTSPNYLLGTKANGAAVATLQIASDMRVVRLLHGLAKLSPPKRAKVVSALSYLVETL
jgi:transcriptional regulator with XRE-family HTH domain